MRKLRCRLYRFIFTGQYSSVTMLIRLMSFLGRMFLHNAFYVSLSKWRPEVNSIQSSCFTFNGGWIAIEGLPFHFWREEVFRKIAENVGGLVKIDRQTRLLDNLFQARIKVKGAEKCISQAYLDVQLGDSKFTLRVWPLSKSYSSLNMDRNRFRNANLHKRIQKKSGNFDLRNRNVVGLRQGVANSQVWRRKEASSMKNPYTYLEVEDDGLGHQRTRGGELDGVHVEVNVLMGNSNKCGGRGVFSFNENLKFKI